MPEILFTHGNEAVVEGALAAGCRFFAGYPITPTTEIMEIMAKRMPEAGGVFIQAEDEIASINAIIGASWAGAKAMTATSGPGFSLMQEGIGLAVMTETPIVIVEAMRGGPSTGVPTRPWQGDVIQAMRGSHGDYELIVLSPYNVQEIYDSMIKAFNLAETYRVPVIVLIDALLAHIHETLNLYIPENLVYRKKPDVPPEEYLPYYAQDGLVPPMAVFGDGYHILVESLTHDERGYPDGSAQERLIKRLSDKIRKNADKIAESRSYMTEDAEYIVVAYGSVARSARAMVKLARKRGVKLGLFRPFTLNPLDILGLEKASRNAEKIIVAEMNYGQYYKIIRAAMGDKRVYSLPWLSTMLPDPETFLHMFFEVIKR